MFDIDKSYSKKDALKIMSVRYSAFLSRYSQYMKVTIANEINNRSIAEIKERSSELPGIDIDTKSIRVYNKSEKHITKERKKKIKITIPVMRRLERPVLRSSLRIIFTETAEARLWLSTMLERSSIRPRQSNREQEIISHYRLTANYRNMYIICSRRRSRELFCLSLQVLTAQEMTVRIL